MLKDFLILIIFLLTTMYLVGYFEVRMTDTLGVGFGVYKLNLLSIFDPTETINNFSSEVIEFLFISNIPPLALT